MKKILFILVVIVFLIIINNLTRSIYSVWQKDRVALDAQKQLNYQKEENEKLKSELSYIETQEFIERQARDKLFMTKPNESIVLDSKDHEGKNLSFDKRDNRENWRKWMELFF